MYRLIKCYSTSGPQGKVREGVICVFRAHIRQLGMKTRAPKQSEIQAYSTEVRWLRALWPYVVTKFLVKTFWTLVQKLNLAELLLSHSIKSDKNI